MPWAWFGAATKWSTVWTMRACQAQYGFANIFVRELAILEFQRPYALWFDSSFPWWFAFFQSQFLKLSLWHQQLPRQPAEVSGAATPGFLGPLPFAHWGLWGPTPFFAQMPPTLI